MNFFLGFLSVCGCFFVCYSLCIAFMLIKNQYEGKRKRAPEKPPKPEPQARVYYIESAKPQKRKKRKPISIPLKATLPPKDTVVVADPELLSSPKKRTVKRVSASASQGKVREADGKQLAPPAKTRRPVKARSSKSTARTALKKR